MNPYDIPLTDDQRRLLAVKRKAISREALKGLAAIVMTPRNSPSQPVPPRLSTQKSPRVSTSLHTPPPHAVRLKTRESGLSVVGRDFYGVFPLKGKPLNVRDATHAQIMKNEEIMNLVEIM